MYVLLITAQSFKKSKYCGKTKKSKQMYKYRPTHKWIIAKKPGPITAAVLKTNRSIRHRIGMLHI